MSSSETTAPRQHAFTGPALPQLPEPTHAERVRTLMSLTSVATLSTISRKHPGFPFGSLMPFALDSSGAAHLPHQQYGHAHPESEDRLPMQPLRWTSRGRRRCAWSRPSNPDWQCRTCTENDVADARERYLARHENSRYWVDFSDFSFFRLQPIDLYYVGGFGVMGWVEAQDYEHAAPDPLAEAAPGILAHMNADHGRCDDPAGAGCMQGSKRPRQR